MFTTIFIIKSLLWLGIGIESLQAVDNAKSIYREHLIRKAISNEINRRN